MATIYWFCPNRLCNPAGINHAPRQTTSIGDSDTCDHCGTELEWRT